LLVEILQEANNSSYSSLAGKSLVLQQKKLILFDFISFLRLCLLVIAEVLSWAGIKYQHSRPIIKLCWRQVACSQG
jgi:hypothetical protein